MKKKVRKNIEKTAALLPELHYEVKEKQWFSGTQMMEMGIKQDDNGDPINPAKRYPIERKVTRPYNHTKRLKQAYLKEGTRGMQKYCKHIANLIEKSKKSDTLKV